MNKNEKQLLADINAGMEIERLYYPDAVIESAALVYPLYQKNAEASVVLRDEKGQPVGVSSIRLDTGKHQPGLMRLYERNGFKEKGVYHSDKSGLDWILYEWDVPGQ